MIHGEKSDDSDKESAPNDVSANNSNDGKIELSGTPVQSNVPSDGRVQLAAPQLDRHRSDWHTVMEKMGRLPWWIP